MNLGYSGSLLSGRKEVENVEVAEAKLAEKKNFFGRKNKNLSKKPKPDTDYYGAHIRPVNRSTDHYDIPWVEPVEYPTSYTASTSSRNEPVDNLYRTRATTSYTSSTASRNEPVDNLYRTRTTTSYTAPRNEPVDNLYRNRATTSHTASTAPRNEPVDNLYRNRTTTSHTASTAPRNEPVLDNLYRNRTTTSHTASTAPRNEPVDNLHRTRATTSYTALTASRNEPVDNLYRTRTTSNTASTSSSTSTDNLYRTRTTTSSTTSPTLPTRNKLVDNFHNSYQKPQIKPWDEQEISDEVRSQLKKPSLGKCIECQKPFNGTEWCRPCNTAHFSQQSSKWTSWRLGLDNLIIRTQITANNVHSFFEWIPFENFDHVTYLAKGGYSTVYKAIWTRGPIIYWDTNDWERSSNHEVVLKVIKGSQKNLDKFIIELTAHHKFNTTVGHIFRCFGISRWEGTGDFVVVTSFAKDGNLRQYIRRNSEKFSWIERLTTLKNITECLEIIHNAGYVHCDLHTGNILRHGSWTIISDLGFTWRRDSMSTGEIFGVLPYIAPEILYDSQYSSASDIYSFAMIMYEIASGEIPFYNTIQNFDPIFVIYGSRPDPPSATPPCYVELMKLCWGPDPKKRPTASDLVRIFDDWINSERKELYGIYSSFQSAELERKYLDSLKKTNTIGKDYTYIDETYTSQLISIRDIANRINQQRLKQKA